MLFGFWSLKLQPLNFVVLKRGIYKMNVKILGNGGAISLGLPYNSFLIDDYFLVETPPDIMNSLFRENIELSKIKVIYISHYHGDHYFGFPFLAIRLFLEHRDNKLTVIGPPDIKTKIEEIFKIALGENHILKNYTENNLNFVEINNDREIKINDALYLKGISMYHSIENYGFSIYEKNNVLLTYFSDTIWNDKLLQEIKEGPSAVITDLNGEATDAVKVHLCEEDLIDKAIPFSKDYTIYYGTHLKKEKKSNNARIKYISPGDIIMI